MVTGSMPAVCHLSNGYPLIVGFLAGAGVLPRAVVGLDTSERGQLEAGLAVCDFPGGRRSADTPPRARLRHSERLAVFSG